MSESEPRDARWYEREKRAQEWRIILLVPLFIVEITGPIWLFAIALLYGAWAIPVALFWLVGFIVYGYYDTKTQRELHPEEFPEVW